uniref:insulin-induced gene 1 protein isoform X1 n=1 Tax=Halichoerus grypus TaxID=9711 RepID=UPI001659D07E|nr:insulin-induced gene 1 protein isoform X1 [Halichoerus grypus]
MRCVAVFVGINHASAKLDFANNVQLSLTLAALSLGLWWTFDRSRSGLGLGITIAFLATLITQLLVYNGVYQYTSPDFLYIRSWLPCIFFSGGVTVGNIGRQLAMELAPENSWRPPHCTSPTSDTGRSRASVADWWRSSEVLQDGCLGGS